MPIVSVGKVKCMTKKLSNWGDIDGFFDFSGTGGTFAGIASNHF